MTAKTLEILSLMLEYPGREYSRLVQDSCAKVLDDLNDAQHESARQSLSDYRMQMNGRTTEEMEDLYTRTFDLNPVCSLDVGWHLYAENYDRGAFLVTLRDSLRRFGIDETNELPDHLPSVLKLLARMPEEERTPLIQQSVLPALKKMLDGFGETDNPFRTLIHAIERILDVMVHTQSGVTAHG